MFTNAVEHSLNSCATAGNGIDFLLRSTHHRSQQCCPAKKALLDVLVARAEPDVEGTESASIVFDSPPFSAVPPREECTA